MTRNENSVLNLFLAFLGGAAVGAGSALLLAPRSGEETRENLGQMAGQAGEYMGGLVNWGKGLVNRGMGQFEEGGDQANMEAGKQEA